MNELDFIPKLCEIDPQWRVNLTDKARRGVGFKRNGEESNFRDVCMYHPDQPIECYGKVFNVNGDFEISYIELAYSCRNCPYFFSKIKNNANRWMYSNFKSAFFVFNIMEDLDIKKDYSNPKSYVYFITDNQFIKIGKANNVESRLKMLQTGNGRELSIIGRIPLKTESEAMKLESALHDAFSQYRRSGEWFDILNVIDINSYKTYFNSPY